MSHILIPTDLSDNALNAASFAVQLFGDEGSRFTLLNCFVAPTSSVSPMWNVDALMAQEAHDGVSRFADRLRGALPSVRPELTTVVEHGPLPQVVAGYAAEADRPTLVAMGTQGASGLKEVLLGSNTADVIKAGHLPVLAVPEKAAYRSPKRIVLADDGGPVDRSSAQVLVDIARWSKAEVMIVRVVNEETMVEPGAADARFDEILGAIPHSQHYLSGENVMTALHDFADHNDADLVVVLHRQRGLFEQLFHRSTATKLAMHTHIPMLVLQQPAS